MQPGRASADEEWNISGSEDELESQIGSRGTTKTDTPGEVLNVLQSSRPNITDRFLEIVFFNSKYVHCIVLIREDRVVVA